MLGFQQLAPLSRLSIDYLLPLFLSFIFRFLLGKKIVKYITNERRLIERNWL